MSRSRLLGVESDFGHFLDTLADGSHRMILGWDIIDALLVDWINLASISGEMESALR